ncbi:hypothetical protein BST61_g207 [Cercospora zeina]
MAATVLNYPVETFPQDITEPAGPVNKWDIEAERDCTVRCLEICAQVTRFIEERHRSLDAYSPDSGSAPSIPDVDGRPSQYATDEMLRGYARIKSQHARLSARLKELNTRLSCTSQDDVPSVAREQMIQETKTIY